MKANELGKEWAKRVLTKHSISLADYATRIYPQFELAPHLKLIIDKLEQVSRYVETRGVEGIPRLIVALPPRHGKTMLVSRIFPTWHLGRNPKHRLMLTSYGQDLANDNSRVARNWLMQDSFKSMFPSVNIASDSWNVQNWNIEGTNGQGGLSAVGVGGVVTGRGAHILIIDDPIKNREQAESETYRQRVWDSFTNDLLTRLEPSGAVVIMHTRWHEDDLIGRLLKEQADKWNYVCLPALAFENDPLQRAVGGALWPARYDEIALSQIRDSMGEYGWASLYEQSPRPSSGGILKRAWFDVLRVIPKTVKAVRYWDLAMSSKTQADYTVGVRMELGQDGMMYITDVARGQKELADLPAFLGDVMLADGDEVYQGFEQKGYMTRALQEIAKKPAFSKYVLKGYDVSSDKLTRALPVASRASLGQIKMKYADWNEAFLEELVSFPVGKHDDQVDALSGAYTMLQDNISKFALKTKVGRYA